MQVQPYVFFNGRCEEAIEFYKQAIGADFTMVQRFKDNPQGAAPGLENKILHANLRIGETTLMAFDGEEQGTLTFQGISLALIVKTDAEAECLFAALAEGGNVHLPLTTTPFSSRFGMLADRFGVAWMISVAV